MTCEEAHEKAKEFLPARGRQEMGPTYSIKENNALTIVFAVKKVMRFSVRIKSMLK